MDREKQKMEDESNTSEPKLTAQTIIPATSKTPRISLNASDDDTSIESSDAFDTWTILNDREKSKSQDNLDESGNSVEILENSDPDEEEECNEEEEEEKPLSFEEIEKQDSFNDDFSDGISIISESESVGRISPHLYTQDHLHDTNLNFSFTEQIDLFLSRMREEIENETVPSIFQEAKAEDQQLRHRRTSSSTFEINNQALQKASQTTLAPINNSFPPLVRRGVQGIFFVGVALAILALIGKILNPTWQPLAKVSSSDDTSELVQKLNDMELQNNLMRAEIDLLNKQVKYLSTLNDPYRQKYPEKYKKLQAWFGNGESLEPVDITKADLRTPYKCPDGSFVEIANMCMEKRPKGEPSLVDQFGKVVEDLKEQSEVFKTFEKVAEEHQGFQDNPFEQLQTEEAQREFIKNKPIYQPSEDPNQNLPFNEKYHKHRPKGEDLHTSAPYKQYKQGKYEEVSKSNKEYKNSFGKDFNKDSKEKERVDWKTDKINNNLKERKYRKDNSKERFNKQFGYDDSHENSKENHSKERYNDNNNKQKHKYNKNGFDDDFNGEWQTNYMKHRENQRKNPYHKYQANKNWYIKRLDSREYKRSGEKQYR